MINWDLVDKVVRAGVERGNGSLSGEMNFSVVVSALGLALDESEKESEMWRRRWPRPLL